MKKTKFTDEPIGFALRKGRSRDAGVGSLPQDGRFGGDLFSLETEIREPRPVGAAQAASTGGGKPEAEAPNSLASQTPTPSLEGRRPVRRR
jgi:hypothetical protein